MKKAIAILMVLSFTLLLLCACSASGPANSSSVEEPASPSELNTEAEAPAQPEAAEQADDAAEADQAHLDNTESEPAAEPEPEPVGTSFVPDFESAGVDVFTVDDGAEIALTGTAIADFAKFYYDAKDLSEEADYIVIGTVQSVYYSDVSASARTLFDFKIDEALRGDFGKNDVITVSEPGGYIRGDVYMAEYGDAHLETPLTAENYVREIWFGVPTPVEGEQYILFLQASSRIEGTYSACGTFQGKYYIDSDGESVHRYTPEDQWYIYIRQGESEAHDQKTVTEIRETVK